MEFTKNIYDIILSLFLTSHIDGLFDKIVVSLCIVIFNFLIDLIVKFIKSKLKTRKYDNLIDGSAEQIKQEFIDKIGEHLTNKDK